MSNDTHGGTVNNGGRRPKNRLHKHEMVVGRFTVPYAVTGDHGIPLVAVNGAQQTMASWISFRKHLASMPSLRLILLDFPGQGRAQINEGSDEVTIEEHIDVLSALVSKLAGGQKIYLVGGSWGGVVAAAYAARHPETVAKLILGSFGTRPNDELMKILKHGQKLFEEDRLDEVASLLIDGFGARLPEGIRSKLRQQFSVIPIRHIRHLYSQTIVFENCQDIAEYVDLGAIQAETLIVNGEKDPIVDRTDTEEAASRIPRCRIELLPDVGHFLHLERPEVLDVYSSFLLGKSS